MDEKLSPMELAEQIASVNYMLGIIVGFDEIIKFLRSRAGDAFALGHDEQAHFYRDLAVEIETTRKSKRDLYDKAYHPKQEEAFEELEHWSETALQAAGTERK